MDADLQNDPEIMIEMIKGMEENYDIVTTCRNRKGESVIKSMFARMFYAIMGNVGSVKIRQGSQDYRMMKRQVAESILSLKEYNRFSKGIFSWVGFNTKWIAYDNIERSAGKTKWNFWKLFVYALDGITAFSTAPLMIATLAGILFCFLAFIMIIAIIVKTCLYGDPVSGWPSMVCIVLLVGGVQLFCLGIMGQYMSKEYMEIKNLPIYIVKETEKDLK